MDTVFCVFFYVMYILEIFAQISAVYLNKLKLCIWNQCFYYNFFHHINFYESGILLIIIKEIEMILKYISISML